MWWVLAFACGEPLVLPDDPAEDGVPVGVRTVTVDDLTVEVWYPASDDAADLPPEDVDPDVFLPTSVTDVLGPVDLPSWPTSARRDADVRPGRAKFPIVLFSHGFGGFRLQSTDYTVHLASRGYVVLAPDHAGRTFGDLVPCLFSPPLDGCDISGFSEDPGPDDLSAVADWVTSLPDDDPLAGRVDPERMAVTGHSQGGASAGTIGQSDDRFDAVVAMAMGPTVTRDVPTLIVGGTCDGIVPLDDLVSGRATSADATLVTIEGSGHLAFSDMCSMDLAAFGATYLEGRDDVNETFYKGMKGLGSDGCPDQAVPAPQTCDETAYLDLGTSAEIVRGETTAFLDDVLKDDGDGIDALTYAQVSVMR